MCRVSARRLRLRRAAVLAAAAAAFAGCAWPLAAQMAGVVSAPVTDIHYEVTVDSVTAAERQIHVVTTLTIAGPGPVVLSLPAWTPGAYQMVWFARWVSGFAPTAADGRALTWGMTDYETWRIEPAGARRIRVAFTYRADTLDNAMSWTQPDFAYFNGTNLFLYPKGRGLTFPATVTIRTSRGWRIATGMTAVPGMSDTFSAPTYHDVVDMPFFIGHFDIDSEQVADRWIRFASYPAGAVSTARRVTVLKWLSQVIPPEAAVFGEIPWPNYTILQVMDSSHRGASALEHQSSHLAIGDAARRDYAFRAGTYAHEIFHSWNVKRMRPADLVPYRYDVSLPTPWLWVSEGITDYYADLAQVRAGAATDSEFYHFTAEKIDQVDGAPPVALNDESLSTWIHPIGAPGFLYLYYQKGSLAGLMLDILIRDASDGRQSLDSVMRAVYTTTYKQQRGFTGTDWWGAVSRAARGRSFVEFNRRYVVGREAFPWDSILPLAGLRLVTDSIREPVFGMMTVLDSGRVRVGRVEPGSAMAEAGLQPGDVLISIGGIDAASVDVGRQLSARYATGAPSPAVIPIAVRRGAQLLTLQAPLHVRVHLEHRIMTNPAATARAVRIRDGLLRGTP